MTSDEIRNEIVIDLDKRIQYFKSLIWLLSNERSEEAEDTDRQIKIETGKICALETLKERVLMSRYLHLKEMALEYKNSLDLLHKKRLESPTGHMESLSNTIHIIRLDLMVYLLYDYIDKYTDTDIYEIDFSKINRFEVIDHRVNGVGRVIVERGLQGFVSSSVQDDGRTLKIFLN